jgi:hypothetical protein
MVIIVGMFQTVHHDQHESSFAYVDVFLPFLSIIGRTRY